MPWCGGRSSGRSLSCGTTRNRSAGPRATRTACGAGPLPIDEQDLAAFYRRPAAVRGVQPRSLAGLIKTRGGDAFFAHDRDGPPALPARPGGPGLTRSGWPWAAATWRFATASSRARRRRPRCRCQRPWPPRLPRRRRWSGSCRGCCGRKSKSWCRADAQVDPPAAGPSRGRHRYHPARDAPQRGGARLRPGGVPPLPFRHRCPPQRRGRQTTCRTTCACGGDHRR